MANDPVNHPPHYGGDTTYETIKVVEAWGLGFHLGNAVKYISRVGRKGNDLVDLQKARWYIDRELQRRQTHEKREPDPGPYRAEPCGCGHPACKAWHVWPVAAVQGVRFTREQAGAVAELLNKSE